MDTTHGTDSSNDVATRNSWLKRWTRLDEIETSLLDEPSHGWSAWARTTAGAVAMLVALQMITGVLLAFYYAPSAESAHTTVAYIEKVAPAGAWIRSLHHYGSQWLTLFLLLHLVVMFWRAGYERKPVAWTAAVLLLAMVLASGATGYSLPWDARAFFATRVTEGIAGGLPLVGSTLRRWLLGGEEISPVTLLRFFALHALVLPALILAIIIARIFVFRERAFVARAKNEQASESKRQRWMHTQLARNALAAGAVFVALALYAKYFNAPLAPAAGDKIAPGYMPRPGGQFLWLFQMLKFLPGRAASVVAVAIPSFIIAGLLALPFLDSTPLRKVMRNPRRATGFALLSFTFALIALMTGIAFVEDGRSPRVRAQLARQAEEERLFRAAPFVPLRLDANDANKNETNAEATTRADSSNGSTVANANAVSSASTQSGEAPAAYLAKCAKCHGAHGEGANRMPKLTNVSAKPRRTLEDIIRLLDDPALYGLEPPMKSFAGKLTDAEKREIAAWVITLKK